MKSIYRNVKIRLKCLRIIFLAMCVSYNWIWYSSVQNGAGIDYFNNNNNKGTSEAGNCQTAKQ